MLNRFVQRMAKYLLPRINFYLNSLLGIRVFVKRSKFSYNYSVGGLAQRTIVSLPKIRFVETQSDSSKVILLIPKVASESAFFAGLRMITALAVEILKRDVPVHFCVTDDSHQGASLEEVRTQILSYFPDAPLDKLSISYNDQDCRYTTQDVLITTAWWTWYSAEDVLPHLKTVYYLIQDFEPGFYPWSSEYALALETYKNKFIPIFSGHNLRDFFIQQGYGFAKEGLKYDLYMNPDTFFLPEKQVLASANRKRKLLLYGRQSAERNMFEMAVQALALLASESGDRLKDWEIISIGEYHPAIKLTASLSLKSTGKMSLAEYAELLRSSDVGVSLMMSPHPSYPPLEMVCSGMTVITNRYANKDLSREFKNIISIDPNVKSLKMALERALNESQNIDLRLKNAQENSFCTSRSESFREAVDSVAHHSGVTP